MALGNPFNVFQYNVLQRMIAQVTGYELGDYIFNIGDCHVYTRHIDNLKIQMEREQFEAPELWINPEVKDFYDFTIDDFKLINYKHGDKLLFEVAV
ncbi:Thymidylate synthase 1 [Bacillus cereus]|nr:Thymidylate synthase 1 [Bacillus cereus]